MKILLALLLIVPLNHLFSQDDFSSILLLDSLSNVISFYATDIDNDGDGDFFIQTYSETPTADLNNKHFKLFWLSNSNDNFSFESNLFNTYGGGFNGLDFEIYDQQFVDIDHDSLIDILTSSYSKVLGRKANGIQWHRNNGNGEFEFNMIDKNEFGQSFGSFIISNLEGDGSEDVIIYKSSNVLQYKYTESGFDNFDLVDTLLTESFQKLYAKDLNKDGKDDLITYNNGVLSWYENDGEGHFNNPALSIANNILADSILFVDLDSDEDQDLITVNYNDGVFFYANNGNGNFETPLQLTNNFDGFNYHFLSFGDLNNDNNLDMVLNSSIEGIKWIKNNGQEDFAEAVEITSRASRYAQLIDYDKDGYLDILSLTDNDEVYLFKNALSDTSTNSTHINILESNFDIRVLVYPNPMSTETTVKFSQLPPFKYDIIVVDINGKAVERILDIRKNNVLIRNHNLSSGNYYINILQHGKTDILGSYKLLVD